MEIWSLPASSAEGRGRLSLNRYTDNMVLIKKEHENKVKMGRKYLQTTYPTKGCFLKHIKDF